MFMIWNRRLLNIIDELNIRGLRLTDNYEKQ